MNGEAIGRKRRVTAAVLTVFLLQQSACAAPAVEEGGAHGKGGLFALMLLYAAGGSALGTLAFSVRAAFENARGDESANRIAEVLATYSMRDQVERQRAFQESVSALGFLINQGILLNTRSRSRMRLETNAAAGNADAMVSFLSTLYPVAEYHGFALAEGHRRETSNEWPARVSAYREILRQDMNLYMPEESCESSDQEHPLCVQRQSQTRKISNLSRLYHANTACGVSHLDGFISLAEDCWRAYDAGDCNAMELRIGRASRCVAGRLLNEYLCAEGRPDDRHILAYGYRVKELQVCLDYWRTLECRSANMTYGHLMSESVKDYCIPEHMEDRAIHWRRRR